MLSEASRKFFERSVGFCHSKTNTHSKAMSIVSYSSTSGAFGSQTAAANDADSSSEDEESVYTFEEAISSWYFGKRPSTIVAYRNRVNDFILWMKENYNRSIDHRLKVKHVRLYFVFKRKTVRQMRATIVVIKSLLVHLFKKKIIRKNIALSFISGKQLPPANERNMSVATVKTFFREAQKKKDPSTLVILQILAYGGLRRGALSSLKKEDIKCTEFQKDGIIIKSYKIHVRDGKGGKARYVPMHPKIGANIYSYAQSLNSVYLFPGWKQGTHLTANSIAMRIKRIAKSATVNRRETDETELFSIFTKRFLSTSLQATSLQATSLRTLNSLSSSFFLSFLFFFIFFFWSLEQV